MPSPILSVTQMREWEQASWAAGKSERDVIANVGRILAQRARSLAQPGARVLVLAGKGNNGEDARQSLPHLPADWQVTALNLSGSDADFSAALAQLEHRPALIIDGLFGTGLNRLLDANWINLLDRINQLQTQVLSIDVPSGLNAETGQPEGAAIRASITLTVGAVKSGLLKQTAWPFVGRLELAPEIGLIPCPATSDLNWTLAADFSDFPPARSAASHKGDFGHVAIIAGSFGFHGAAVLASRGAQRAQPGLVTVFTTESAYPFVAPQLQAAMSGIWHPNLKLSHFDGLLVGPGLAAEGLPEILKTTVAQIWQHAPIAMIVDASALAWLPQNSPHHSQHHRVITPHPGEAARLLNIPIAEVQANRVQALRALSQKLGNCWVVLKGQQTLIGRSTGTILVNSTGNPHLAQGGSGDLLSGYLAGLLAQPALRADPLKTIAFAVFQHGAAADRLTATRSNWIIEDLAAVLGSNFAK